MARTEKQLQTAYEKGKISLSEFHEALGSIGTARHARDIEKKKNRASMSSTKWFLKRRRMETKYLSCAETAKLVRTALKKNFPGVKFSVRSSVYSGGASIDVSWILGPTTKEADAVAGQYESAEFDGSIDMETRYDHWLLPDGSAIIKHGLGTEGSMGYIPAVENPMPAGAIPVSFGAHYIQCQRRYAAQWQDETTMINQVAADMCKLQGIAWNGQNLTTGLFGSGDTEQVTQHAWRLLNATSFALGEVYSGVRFEKEGEDNGLNLPFVIIKQGDSPVTRVRSEQ